MLKIGFHKQGLDEYFHLAAAAKLNQGVVPTLPIVAQQASMLALDRVTGASSDVCFWTPCG